MALPKSNDEKLLAIVRKHPGLDAIALKGKGWRPQVHGSLRDAEKRGVVIYKNGGWYPTDHLTRPKCDV